MSSVYLHACLFIYQVLCQSIHPTLYPFLSVDASVYLSLYIFYRSRVRRGRPPHVIPRWRDIAWEVVQAVCGSSVIIGTVITAVTLPTWWWRAVGSVVECFFLCLYFFFLVFCCWLTIIFFFLFVFHIRLFLFSSLYSHLPSRLSYSLLLFPLPPFYFFFLFDYPPFPSSFLSPLFPSFPSKAFRRRRSRVAVFPSEREEAREGCAIHRQQVGARISWRRRVSDL